MFTDSPVELVQAEEQHRDHVIVEQVFADWTDGPLGWPYSGPTDGAGPRPRGCLRSASRAGVHHSPRERRQHGPNPREHPLHGADQRPRSGGWRQWVPGSGTFERHLAGNPAVIAARIDSQTRRGRDYVRVTAAIDVAAPDVAGALTTAWQAFREAVGDDAAGWDLAANRCARSGRLCGSTMVTCARG